MNLYRKYRVKILEIFNIFIFLNNYKISYYFSRLGNNLQQIAIGILYVQKIGGNYYHKTHPLVDNFSIVNKPIAHYFSLFKQHHRFFYFKEKKDFPEKNIDTSYILNNIEKTFKDYIFPNVNFLNDLTIPEDTLVIHIRSGDIFEIPINSYFQNPINYYRLLIEEYQKVILVTSKDKNNPVIETLLKENKVTLHTSTTVEDFNILFNAVNLASSGVGTFPIAAALLSQKLENFHYTNLFSEEHLNPKMLISEKIIHHSYTVQEGYEDLYLKEQDLSSLISNESIKVEKN